MDVTRVEELGMERTDASDVKVKWNDKENKARAGNASKRKKTEQNTKEEIRHRDSIKGRIAEQQQRQPRWDKQQKSGHMCKPPVPAVMDGSWVERTLW